MKQSYFCIGLSTNVRFSNETSGVSVYTASGTGERLFCVWLSQNRENPQRAARARLEPNHSATLPCDIVVQQIQDLLRCFTNIVRTASRYLIAQQHR